MRNPGGVSIGSPNSRIPMADDRCLRACAVPRRCPGTGRFARLGLVGALLIGAVAATTTANATATGVDAAPVAPVASAGVAFTGLAFDGQPTFEPVALLAAAATNPWLLVGTKRPTPGAPTDVVVFAAAPTGDAAQLVWEDAALVARAADDPPGAPYAAIAAAAGPDGRVVVVGSVERDGTNVTLVWDLAAGVATTPLDVPLPAGAAVVPGAVSVDDRGALWLLFDQPGVGYGVAERAPDGSWNVVSIGVLSSAVRLNALATAGDTVVLVGADLTTVPSAPLVIVSADRGGSFALAALAERFTPVSFAGSMRAVRRGPDGFFATVCTERPTGPMVSLAYSPDGLAWDELPGVATLELPPVTAAQCGDLAVDGIGGVWFAPIGGQQGDFVRLAGGAVTGRLGYAVAGDLELANGTPLLAADGAQLVAVVPTFGGAAAFAQATDDPDRTQLVAIGSPLSGRPAFAGLDTRDDRGTVVAVNAFPQLVALADGTTQWATQTRSYVVLDDGEAIADDAVNAIDVPERRGTPIVVTTAAQQVAIVNRTEFDTAADPGASGDVAVLLRPTGGSWSVAVPMLQSPGDQFVVDAAVSGDVVIAAGRSTTLDPATGALVPSPLIVVGDGVNWQTLVPPAEANDFVVSAVCPTGTGTAVLVGRALSTGARISLLLDTATATVTVLPGVVAEAAPDELLVECGYNAADTATPFVARTGTGVYVSADAVTWTLVHAVPPGWRLRQLAVGRAGVAVMSNSGGVNSDFAVHIGAHASALQSVQSAEFAGPGDHEGGAISVRGDVVLVYGSVNDLPMRWRVAAS